MNWLDYSPFSLGARWSLLLSSPCMVSSPCVSADGFIGELFKRFHPKAESSVLGLQGFRKPSFCREHNCCFGFSLTLWHFYLVPKVGSVSYHLREVASAPHHRQEQYGTAKLLPVRYWAQCKQNSNVHRCYSAHPGSRRHKQRLTWKISELSQSWCAGALRQRRGQKFSVGRQKSTQTRRWEVVKDKETTWGTNTVGKQASPYLLRDKAMQWFFLHFFFKAHRRFLTYSLSHTQSPPDR